jgi:hypothetical protein
MKSLAVRVTLVALFVIATAASAYLFWLGESRAAAETRGAGAFAAQAAAAARSTLDLRAAQQAYVATGQGEDFWESKVSAGLEGLRDTLGTLRTEATSPQAQSEIDGALASLQDFDQIDRRARDYASSGHKLLASDLIFSDGLETTGGALAAVDRARDAELEARSTAAQGIRRRQVYALGAAAAAALLVVLLLAPRAAEAAPSIAAPEPMRVPDHHEGLDLGTALDEGWSQPRRAGDPATSPLPASAIDLSGVAALCTDLARIVDTQALPAILERAATVIDATGIVLWIADPDGRELSPIVTHGYAPAVVSRLGTILRGSENATAAAFRTSLLQTVRADSVSHGAIAAPLVTPAGCVGVMAAEVRSGGEKDPSKLAAATIVAAQLATLVGPPSSRAQAKVEAAGG